MPRRKTITIKEVARVAGVSVTTVSNYLNGQMSRMSEETRNKVQQVIEDLNYRPSAAAQSMRSNSTKVIGVIVGDISNIFSSLLCGGIQQVLRPKQYSVMLLSTDDDPSEENRCLDALLRQDVDGIIMQPTQENPEAFYPIVTARKPLVLVDGQVKAVPVNAGYVTSDNMQSSSKACAELHERGYRHIVTVFETTAPTSSQQPRLAALRNAAEKQSMRITALDVNGHENTWLAQQIQQAYATGERVVIFPLMGPLLSRTLLALRIAGLSYPKDLGLISFADSNWAQFVGDRGIDLIQRDINQIGRLAGENILQILEQGKPEHSEIMVPSKRIAGGSL